MRLRQGDTRYKTSNEPPTVLNVAAVVLKTKYQSRRHQLEESNEIVGQSDGILQQKNDILRQSEEVLQTKR